MAGRIISATVRAVKPTRPLPSRAALVLPALIALHVSVKIVSSPETPKLPRVIRKLLADRGSWKSNVMEDRNCHSGIGATLGHSKGMNKQEKVETPSAEKRIQELMKDKTKYIGLKLGVKTRGCNGLSYTLDYATTKGKMDEEIIQNGVRIIIDPKAQLTLLGTEMDYVETKLENQFVFNNPNIKGICGCGESFNI